MYNKVHRLVTLIKQQRLILSPQCVVHNMQFLLHPQPMPIHADF